MKRILLTSLVASFLISQIFAQKVSTGKSTTNTTPPKGSGIANITNDEAGSAIKEALNKGVSAAVDIVGKRDGYWKNNLIKIPFPQEASMVANTLRRVGAGVMVDRVTESLNRAAEDAAQAAKPILINSIKQITVTDAINIIKGSQKDAATRFLQRTAGTQLIAAFKPAIQKSLDKTLATKYWKEATTRYNRVPLVKKVNTDLADYTTRKALDGLFVMVGKEEEKIRQNPKAFGSNLIDKVFGGLLGK